MPYPEAMSSHLREEYWVFLLNKSLFLGGKLGTALERYGIFFFTVTA